MEVLDHNKIQELNVYFHESEIHPQIFNRLKLLSQQIKNFNKKNGNPSFNFIPSNQKPNYNSQNYSIPHNPSKDFQFKSQQVHQPEPPQAPENPPVSTSPTPFHSFPPQDFPPPPPSFNYEPHQSHSFRPHQSSFEAPEEAQRTEQTPGRTMPEIAFQQIEGHAYRSQKRGNPSVRPMFRKESSGPSLVKLIRVLESVRARRPTSKVKGRCGLRLLFLRNGFMQKSLRTFWIRSRFSQKTIF